MADRFVLTPGGYKLAKNVHFVPPGHSVNLNQDLFEIRHPIEGLVRTVGKINRRAAGVPLLPTHVTRRPPIERSELELAVAAPAAGEVNGWVSYASWRNTSREPISSFSTTWIVPDEPTNKGDQLVYLFNGIQNSTMILQPVLQWGTSPAGGNKNWAVGSWYADSTNGHSFYSLLVDVAPGDEITGVMSLTDRNGRFCSYTSEFLGMPDTKLPVYNVDELMWANATLEAYKIEDRADFPSSNDTIFSKMDLQTTGGVPPVNWQANSDVPASGSAATILINSAAGGSVEITY